MIALKIDQDGVYEKEYTIETPEQLQIDVSENVHATIVLTLVGKQVQIEKKVILQKNSSLHLLYRNEVERLESDEEVNLYENAHLQVGYFEVNNAITSFQAVYKLLAQEARVEVITTTYAKQSKKYDITCLHAHPHTYSNMENYAINDSDGKINITASGNIQKGAKGSKSHQSTRVLTLAQKESVKVTPLLLIDENDVEASHACGIGEMNEDHLYYLQTRGLNKRQALGLLTLSYLLPICKVVEHNEALKQQMEEEIQSKVGLAC